MKRTTSRKHRRHSRKPRKPRRRSMKLKPSFMKKRRKSSKLAGTNKFTKFMRKKITGDPNKGIRDTATNNLKKYFFNSYDSDDDEDSPKYSRTPSPSELTSAEKILRDIQIQKGVERRLQSRRLRQGALATMHPSALISEDQRKTIGIGERRHH